MSNYFKSQKEIYEHLIKGGMVESSEYIVKLDIKGNTSANHYTWDKDNWQVRDISFLNYDKWQPYTETENPKRACAFICPEGTIAYCVEGSKYFNEYQEYKSWTRSPQYDIEPKEV